MINPTHSVSMVKGHMVTMFLVLYCLLVTLLLQVNSSPLSKSKENDYADKGRASTKLKYGRDQAPCWKKCGRGRNFSCTANCTSCPVCSYCNNCSCKCEKHFCSPPNGLTCSSVLTPKCKRYENGCYCYCGIAPLKRLSGGFLRLK
ncbi:uncharacterized protein LOC142790183 isoform X2 [Rhipicephalus microplus]|uniref:uncharacterized protein LOC142790183 isoform X2 n=1 Tax=Rhipicephalus microplus TaxID=6941 RepID=UPI003F6B726B